MSQDIATLGIRVDAREVGQADQALQSLATSGDKAEQSAKKLSDSASRLERDMKAVSAALRDADAAELKFLNGLQREIDLFGANRAEVERYNASMAGYSNATVKAAAALGAKIDAMEREEAAARAAAAAEDSATKASEQFLAKLRDQVATLGMTTTQLQAYRAAQLGVSDAAAPLIAKLAESGEAVKKTGGHMEGLSFQTAGAKRELLVLAHELSQGNFSRFGGSMMVLGEQTGAAGLLFSAAGLAVLTFVAALGGIAYAVFKGASEQRAMNNALIETGNYAGATSDSLNNMAHAAVEAGGSLREAKKAVTELAASGKFTGDQIGYISDAAIAMEHATGKSIEATIKEFESLAVQTSGNTMRSTEAISRASLKLDDTYHFLTESVYEQIRALEKEGDQKGASAVATEALAKVTKERAEEMKANIGTLAREWNKVKEVIDKVSDGLGNIGKRATPGTDVAKYSAQLADFDRGLQESNSRLGRPSDSIGEGLAAARLKIVMNLTKAVEDLNKADAAAITQGKATMAQSEASHAASRIEQDDIRLGKKGLTELDDAIQKYGEDLAKIAEANPASKLLDQDEVNKHMALIVKAHSVAAKGNNDQAKLLQDALTVQQAALDREKSIYDARESMLTMYHTKFGLSDDDFYAGRAAARAEYIASEAITFAKEAALVNASVAKTPQEVAAKKAKYDELVRAHQKFVDEMRNAGGADILNQLADRTASVQQSDDAINKYISSLEQEAQKLEDANKGREDSKGAVERETVARLDNAIAYQEQFIAQQLVNGATDEELAQAPKILKYLQDVRAEHERIAGALDQADADKASKQAEAASRRLADQAIQDWKTAGDHIADSLSTGFGSGGKALGQMFKAYSQGMAGQLKAQKELSLAKKLAADDPEKAEAINRAQLAGAQAQVKSYGDMAQAAQGFFDQGSRGYQAMAAASEVLRAAEVGLSVIKGVNAVLTQGEGDPYSAFARMAAMTALVAGLGVALSGGAGGGVSAADRQKTQGAGTVFGDGSAKSDSIARAIELSASNSSTQIDYLGGMLQSLRSIESNIGSFANQVLQNSDISSPSVNLNKNNGGATTFALGIISAVAGPIGILVAKIPVLSNLVGKIATSIFGGKQSLDDTGFTMDKGSLASIIANGANGKSYADITTSGGWFSSDKHNTQTTSLGTDANQQFTLILKSMADGIGQAADLLGVAGSDFDTRLSSFVVDIGKVSLKGLTGEDQQKALEAVFSKLGDQMAQWAVSGLSQFAKVGEGYLETLTRVAVDSAKIDASMQSMGRTFGATGIQSIAAREALVDLMGGIDELQSSASNFAQNFLSKAEQLAPVAKFVSDQLTKMNLGWVDTRDEFKNVVLGLDLTTDAGRQTYATLMGLSDAFASVHEAAKDTSKTMQEIADERADLMSQLDDLTLTSAQKLAKQRAALDASNQSLFDQVQAAQAAKDAQDAARESLQKMADDYRNLNKSLESFGASLVTGNLSTLTTAQQEAEARKRYEATSQAALGGDMDAITKFQDIANQFLTISQKANGGDARYMSDYANVLAMTDKLATLTDDKADVALQQLDAAERQVAGIEALAAIMTASQASLQTIAQSVVTVPTSNDNAELIAEIAALRQEMKDRDEKAAQAAQQTAADTATANTQVTMQSANLIVGAISTLRPSATAKSTAATLDI